MSPGERIELTLSDVWFRTRDGHLACVWDDTLPEGSPDEIPMRYGFIDEQDVTWWTVIERAGLDDDLCSEVDPACSLLASCHSGTTAPTSPRRRRAFSGTASSRYLRSGAASCGICASLVTMDPIDVRLVDAATGQPPVLRHGTKMVFTTRLICLEGGTLVVIPDAVDSTGRDITLCQVGDE